ncbi:MAG: DUF58 domain-containing protein [Planctomycetia bacterium]|nr:DUF58 domain-containing protein [Planctomycetia bacterium]
MSVRQQGGSDRRPLSWLGFAAIAGGLTLIWLYFEHPELSKSTGAVYPLLFLGGGCGLVAWGVWSLWGEARAMIDRLRNRSAHQYRVRMPREALLYFLILLVLCAGAFLGGSNMLMLVFGLMAGPFVLNGQVTLGMLKKLSVSRTLPARATVGESFAVKLSLTNRKRLLSSWMVSAEDYVQGPGEQLQPVALFACVPPASTREAFYEICPARRGVHEFGPIRMISRFPLGLMERSIELGAAERMIVYPRIGRMKPLWRTPVESGDMAFESASSGIGASHDEFHSLREYRSGDNPRAIHWRTTARRNELMVREFQHSRRNDLILAVELWQPPRPRPDDLTRVELAISLAASICVDHLQLASDSTIDLILCGRETFHGSGYAGAASLSGLLEQLALAQGGDAAGLMTAALTAALTARNRVRKVLITSRPAEQAPQAGRPAAADVRSDAHRVLADEPFEIYAAGPELVLDYVEFTDAERGETA